jgi:cell wall-associated NlpC family hydrolase
MYKSLITFLFLGISSVLWSQENNHKDSEPKLVSVVHELLFKNIILSNENAISDTQDTVINYRLIRSNIFDKACNYLGVNYRYGQSSEKGFDCSGFVKYIFRNFGFDLPHSAYYLYKITRRIESTEAQCGDLVFFITRGKGVSHVGIYLGNNQFIHSPGRGRTVSIDSLGAKYYKRHLVGFGSVL